MKHLVLVARVVFGAWMLLSGANHFFFNLWPEPAGHTPLAIQLMTGLRDGWMLDIAMIIQLVTGALILVGVLVPVALCVVMPTLVCGAFWAVILEHEPLGALLALLAVGLNALLCLAYIDYYQGMLQRRALSLGETEGGLTFESLYVDWRGRTGRNAFIGALITLLAAYAFYYFLVHAGRNGEWVRTVFLFPIFVLAARRLHDMGRTALLLLLPGAPIVAYVYLHLMNPGTAYEPALGWIGLALGLVFAIWGAVGRSSEGPNPYGVPAAA